MLVLDTYNILHASGVLPIELAGLDTQSLVQLLSVSRFRHREVVMVCDGGGPSDSAGRRLGEGRARGTIRVVFAGARRQADDEIERIIAEQPRTKGLTIVSSDRRIKKAAKAKGFEHQDSPSFLRMLAADWSAHQSRSPDPRAHPHREEIPLDPASVAVWARHLGVEGASANQLAHLVQEAEHVLKALHARAAHAAEPAVSDAASRAKGRAAHRPKPGPAEVTPPPGVIAQELADLLKEYNHSAHPADLDMHRWLNHHAPTSDPPPKSRSPRTAAHDGDGPRPSSRGSRRR